MKKSAAVFFLGILLMVANLAAHGELGDLAGEVWDGTPGRVNWPQVSGEAVLVVLLTWGADLSDGLAEVELAFLAGLWLLFLVSQPHVLDSAFKFFGTPTVPFKPDSLGAGPGRSSQGPGGPTGPGFNPGTIPGPTPPPPGPVKPTVKPFAPF